MARPHRRAGRYRESLMAAVRPSRPAVRSAESLAVGTANLALYRVIRPGRQGLAFGVKHAAVPAAMLLAGLAAPLVAERIGWRWAFLLATAFPLLAMALTGWRLRTSAREAPEPPPGPAAGPLRAYPAGGALAPDPVLPAGNGPARPAAPAPAGRLGAGSRRQLGLLAAAAGLGAFSSSSLGACFVLFGVSRGLAAATAGLAVAAASAVNITMRVLVGAAVDRLGWHPLRIVGALLATGAVGFALLAGARGWLLFVAAALAYGCGWAWQGLVHLGAVRFFPQAPGHATGVVRTGIAAGAGTGPLLAGLLIGGYGYGLLWLLLAVLGLAAGGGMVLVARWLGAAGHRYKGVRR